MSRGIGIGPGKSAATINAFMWLSNVKVGERKEGSSGPASKERDGRSRSRLSLKMKQLEPAAATVADRMGSTELAKRRRSESRSRAVDGQDSTGQSLQDELSFFSWCIEGNADCLKGLRPY
jgi:hypothetical protein